MLRILDIGPEGPPTVATSEDLLRPPPQGVLRWIDLEPSSSELIELMGRRFDFHPLTIEDCLHFDQRAKLEEYDGYTFFVTHGAEVPASKTGSIQLLELHTFLSDSYVITVRASHIAPLDRVWQRIQGDPDVGRHGVDFIYYLIVDGIVDEFFPLLDLLESEVEDLQDSILRQSGDADLADLYRLKRRVVTIRKVVAPEREVFSQLSKRVQGRIADRTARYFRDVHDHLLRIHETVDAVRELLTNAVDAYLWATSQRTNEIMKRLTVLSAVFLPLTFITGFFGQNFKDLPYGSDFMMFLMLLSCLLVPAGMIYFFLRSKWY